MNTTASVFVDATRPRYLALLLHDPILYLRVAWPRIRDQLLSEDTAVTKLVKILRGRLTSKQESLEVTAARKTAIDGTVAKLELERARLVGSGYERQLARIAALLETLKQVDARDEDAAVVRAPGPDAPQAG
jgi:hypothetical protein